MSYLFSWRGYWEMIWRWRSVPFQPLFFLFFGSLGSEKMAVWHQGRQGRISNLFTQTSMHSWARHGTACKHRAHVQKSGSAPTSIFVSFQCIGFTVSKDLREARSTNRRWISWYSCWNNCDTSCREELNHLTLSWNLHITNCNCDKAAASSCRKK